MSCREYQHQISLFLYEELPEDQQPGLESHIQQCENCRHARKKGLHYVLAEDAALLTFQPTCSFSHATNWAMS
jgi:hypothetical protein